MIDLDTETAYSYALDFATPDEKARLRDRMNAHVASTERSIAEELESLANDLRNGNLVAPANNREHPFLSRLNAAKERWQEAQYFRHAAKKIDRPEK